MKDLLEKLSSYNLLNYLLPGTVFAAIADATTNFHFVQEDIFVGVFLYYFIGLVISRLGSIAIEPLFRRTKFVVFADYDEYISASKEDELIEVLSEANNMYRTFCSLFVCLILILFYEQLLSWIPDLNNWTGEIFIFSLALLFGFSYRKQTNYISRRVEKASRRNE